MHIVSSLKIFWDPWGGPGGHNRVKGHLIYSVYLPVCCHRDPYLNMFENDGWKDGSLPSFSQSTVSTDLAPGDCGYIISIQHITMIDRSMANYTLTMTTHWKVLVS